MPRRRSLTTTFAVVSLVAMSALGVSLVALVSQLIKQQSLDEAIRTASAYATAGIEQKVSVAEWKKEQLDPATIADFRALATNRTGVRLNDTLLAVRLWGVSGRQLFDSSSTDATGFPDGQRLDDAVQQGIPSAALVNEVRPEAVAPKPATTSSPARPRAASPPATAGAVIDPTQEDTYRSDVRTVLDVYVPARSGAASVGAIEVVLNYAPTAAATGDAVRNVAMLVLAGLGVVWILLFRTVRNASKRLRQSAAENARLALLDPLTGLPNRRLLSERLERAVDAAIADGTHVGLLLLDIDRFKEINDSLGHDRGDQLLVLVARRLEQVVARPTPSPVSEATSSRSCCPPSAASTTRRSWPSACSASSPSRTTSTGWCCTSRPRSGWRCCPSTPRTSTALMKRADVAMYAAKAARRGMSIYSAEGDASSPAELLLLGDLRKAIDTEGELSVHYQPKMDLRTGEVAGLEALLRWQHPTRGMIPPSEFIPLAEQTGLIHALTRWVLAARAPAAGVAARGCDIPVAVNLSARNLADPTSTRRSRELLEEYGVPAQLLEFEITESAIVQDPERAAIALSRIAAMGSTIAIDDFGIGNTSISQLARPARRRR